MHELWQQDARVEEEEVVEVEVEEEEVVEPRLPGPRLIMARRTWAAPNVRGHKALPPLTESSKMTPYPNV